MKQKFLFLCSNNSTRSQIAKGFLITLFSNKCQDYSASIKKNSLNPYIIEVMREIGIDTPKQYTKTINEFKDMQFDYIVTLCSNAGEARPFFPEKKVLHKNFEGLTVVDKDIEEILEFFCKVRDEIKKMDHKNLLR